MSGASMDMVDGGSMDMVDGGSMDMADGGSMDMVNVGELPNAMVDDRNIEGDSSDDLDDDEIANLFGDIAGSLDDIDPKRNPLLWVQSQITQCVNPRTIIHKLIPDLVLPDDVPELSVWRLIFEIITEPAPRQRLHHVSTIENVVSLIKNCKRILVLTGAGVSVSCGIPDFRSRDGIYARLSQDFPDLPDPQSMFDIHFFRCNPCPFFRFAKEIYPGRFAPSLSHRFIEHLESSGRLLRNYTQNIDTLEQVAGIKNVVHCHGSFATATCMNCKLKVSADDIEPDVFAQRIPHCKSCTPNTEDGVMNILKPDIVFFGEGLPEEFHKKIEEDKEKADLLIVMGSSLKVRPVALIPSFLKPDVPQILINREPLPHMQFDVELYGNCDDVINQLCLQLGDESSHITNLFTQNPVDIERYKAFLPVDDLHVEIETNHVQSNGHCANIVVSKPETASNENIQISNNKDAEGDAGGEDPLQSNENCDDSLKRKEENIDGSSSKSKKQKLTESYYLQLPPNCYIFYGAEMDCPQQDSDSDSLECLDNPQDKDEPVKDVPCSTSTSVECIPDEIQDGRKVVEDAEKVVTMVTNVPDNTTSG